MISLIPTAHAASKAQISAQCFVDKINDAILFPLIALMMALAFLFFLYGAFEYVRNASNDAGRETGRRHLMYGVIGMLIMLSAFAILNIAAGTFGLNIDEYRCTNNADSSKSSGKFSGSSLNTQPNTSRGPSDGYIPSWSGEAGESFGGDSGYVAYDGDETNSNILRTDQYEGSETNGNILRTDQYEGDETTDNILRTDQYEGSETTGNSVVFWSPEDKAKYYSYGLDEVDSTAEIKTQILHDPKWEGVNNVLFTIPLYSNFAYTGSAEVLCESVTNIAGNIMNVDTERGLYVCLDY